MPSRLKLCLVVLCTYRWIFAQSIPAPLPDADQKPGSIAGTGRRGWTSQPLRRAKEAHSPAEAGGSSLAQITDDKGKFSFPKVAPGTYSVSVQRDGYLKQTAGRIGKNGRAHA